MLRHLSRLLRDPPDPKWHKCSLRHSPVLHSDAWCPFQHGLGAEHNFSVSESRIDSVGIGQSALCHIFTAATTPAVHAHDVLHERPHVEGLSGGLREYQRGLRRRAAEQRNHIRSLPDEFLGEQL